MEFKGFAKIPRLSREIIITEKIDGTNALIYIEELEGYAAENAIYQAGGLTLYAGSRTRWITPGDDNYGFAAWCMDNAEELLKLGPGRHFGEWWGQGVQRGYGLKEKRFSLFNVSKWGGINAIDRPACCSVVPVLASGAFTTDLVENAITMLKTHGSYAAEGFMRPEGIIIYHTAGNLYFKKTIEKDEQPKTFRR